MPQRAARPLRERHGGAPPRRLWPRLLLELLVVFIGVSAAFALSEYQRKRDALERRVQLQEALAREIRSITANTGRVAEQVPRMLVVFDSLVLAGERPPLQPMIEPVRVHTHMWEATLQSGGLDLFEVATVFQLSQFYNELNAGFEQLEQLRHLSETVLIPNLDSGPDEFYEPQQGRLRRKYSWYRQGLGRLGELAGKITVLGDSLAAELDPAGS